jgi:hypothetical protein
MACSSWIGMASASRPVEELILALEIIMAWFADGSASLCGRGLYRCGAWRYAYSGI